MISPHLCSFAPQGQPGFYSREDTPRGTGQHVGYVVGSHPTWLHPGEPKKNISQQGLILGNKHGCIYWEIVLLDNINSWVFQVVSTSCGKRKIRSSLASQTVSLGMFGVNIAPNRSLPTIGYMYIIINHPNGHVSLKKTKHPTNYCRHSRCSIENYTYQGLKS